MSSEKDQVLDEMQHRRNCEEYDKKKNKHNYLVRTKEKVRAVRIDGSLSLKSIREIVSILPKNFLFRIDSRGGMDAEKRKTIIVYCFVVFEGRNISNPDFELQCTLNDWIVVDKNNKVSVWKNDNFMSCILDSKVDI